MGAHYIVKDIGYYLLNIARDSETQKRDMFIFCDSEEIFKANSSKNTTGEKSANEDYILGLNNIFIAQQNYFTNFVDGEYNIAKDHEASPMTFGIYRHYKNKDFSVIGVGLNIKTFQEMVIYRALYDSGHGHNSWWVQSKNRFFENVSMPEFNYTGSRFKLISQFK